MVDKLDQLVRDIRRCRICVDEPIRQCLPHEPRPVLQVSSNARVAVCGQAPGTKVHLSGRPFADASGERLRDWMGVSEAEFYDSERIAIIPMGFCFPGQNERGADLPPRVECSLNWHERLMAHLPQLELILVVGKYAVAYHLPEYSRRPLYELVADYKNVIKKQGNIHRYPLPHPSWRNNHWLKSNGWFAAEYVPLIRKLVREHIERPPGVNEA